MRGSIRETYYPVFGVTTSDQQDRFHSVAETLELEYNTVRPDEPDWPTELRPANDGTVLGRILYSLGAPRQTEAQETALIPPYVRHYQAHAQRFVAICCLHLGTNIGQDSLTISIPPRIGAQFPAALQSLISGQLGWTVTMQSGRELHIENISNLEIL
jgi:hypothetical protein